MTTHVRSYIYYTLNTQIITIIIAPVTIIYFYFHFNSLFVWFAGYYSNSCDKLCEPGSFGHLCRHTCECGIEGTESCDRHSGECICKPGWKGKWFTWNRWWWWGWKQRRLKFFFSKIADDYGDDKNDDK